jgi:hypothetical protein
MVLTAVLAHTSVCTDSIAWPIFVPARFAALAFRWLITRRPGMAMQWTTDNSVTHPGSFPATADLTNERPFAPCCNRDLHDDYYDHDYSYYYSYT